jgi:hypothetical protein
VSDLDDPQDPEDPQDRILDVALERLLDQPRSDDAAERILAAWRRGVTGTGLDGLEPEAEEIGSERIDVPDSKHPLTSVPATQGSGLRLLRVAAAVLLVGGAIAVWSSRTSRPKGPHLLADRRVAVLDEAGRSIPSKVVRAGQRVLVDGGAAATFTWPDAENGDPGRRLVASAESVFEWRPGELQLWRGELQVDAKEGPLDLDLNTARVTLESGTSAVARVAWLGDLPFDTDNAGPETLALGLTSGSASIAYGAFEQRLVAGEGWELPGDPDAWWQGTGRPLVDLCGQLPRLVLPGQAFNPDSWLRRHLLFDRIAGEIVAVLERDVLTWEVLESHFMEARDYESGEFSPSFVDFLAWEQSSRALELARQMWIESPQSFTEEHLVAFAGRGGFEFERELRALAEAGSVELDSGLAAAAYFAWRGDDVGRQLLSAMADFGDREAPFRDIGGWNRALLASRAMGWLGDPEPWDRLLDRMVDVIPAALDQGSLTYAAFMFTYADYFATEGPGVLTRIPTDVYLALHYDGLRERLDSPMKVRDMLAELAGRW